MIDLSVLIISWNTRQLLAECLDSLARRDVRQDLALEIIVVDNASTDGSADLVREQYGDVHLVQNRQNVGFARANNQAMALATGRYVMLLNSDTVVHAGALDALVRFMDTHQQVGGCGPRLLNEDGSLQPSCHPVLSPWREFWRLVFLDRLVPLATYRQHRWPVDRPRAVDVIKGACLVLRQETLDVVGRLDEQYFMYTEEMDLCLRIALAGWLLYWVPNAVVVHLGEASSQQVAQAMYVHLYRSKAQFHRKFGGVSRVRWFKFLIVLAYLPRLAIAAVAGERMKPQFNTYRALLSELGSM